MMKQILMIMLICLPVLLMAQEERKYIRDGYKAYMDENYTEAEVDFRKAEDANDQSFAARYNTSVALYQQDKLEESGKRFTELAEKAEKPADRAKLMHNLGNVMMKGQQYQQAVEAYKQSLKLNPDDEDTRYNLAYALEKLREQQQQQQQQQKNNKNQDQEENEKQKGDDNKQQQQDQQQDNQKDQQQGQDKQEEQQQGQQPKQQLSKEEAQRLLNAILQKEKDVKEKVDKQKAQAVKKKSDKDW